MASICLVVCEIDNCESDKPISRGKTNVHVPSVNHELFYQQGFTVHPQIIGSKRNLYFNYVIN